MENNKPSIRFDFNKKTLLDAGDFSSLTEAESFLLIKSYMEDSPEMTLLILEVVLVLIIIPLIILFMMILVVLSENKQEYLYNQ